MNYSDFFVFATPWQQLIHPVVRDLAWAVFSEPLLLSDQLGDPALANGYFPCTAARWRWLRELDRDPALLVTSLRPSSLRLGLYFEALWHFFLSADPAVRLLGHNVPVRSGGRTLGEFDVLYECLQSGRQVHLELTVKFYLGLPNSAVWLGPGQRDQLQLKAAHLLRRQSRLATVGAARDVLAGLGIQDPSALRREIEFKGYLFQPAPDIGHCRLPTGHNERNTIERWLTLEAFEREYNGRSCELRAKGQWLSPCRGTLGAAPAVDVAAQLRAAFAAALGPQLVVCCDDGGNELARVFVTPSYWPEHVF